MTATSIDVDLGDRPECRAALKAHPDRGARTKGESCPNCEYGYLEGI
jgi:hypothetical protein